MPWPFVLLLWKFGSAFDVLSFALWRVWSISKKSFSKKFLPASLPLAHDCPFPQNHFPHVCPQLQRHLHCVLCLLTASPMVAAWTSPRWGQDSIWVPFKSLSWCFHFRFLCCTLIFVGQLPLWLPIFIISRMDLKLGNKEAPQPGGIFVFVFWVKWMGICSNQSQTLKAVTWLATDDEEHLLFTFVCTRGCYNTVTEIWTVLLGDCCYLSGGN